MSRGWPKGKPRPDMVGDNNPMCRPEVAAARGESQRGSANVMTRAEVRKKRTDTIKQRGSLLGNQNARGSKHPNTLKHNEAIKRGLAKSERFYSYLHSHCGTGPEVMMAAILLWQDIAFVSQKRIGSRVVDFYLPASDSVIEVDGVYWHPNGPDKIRDAYLLERVNAVFHVTDEDLRMRGWC